MPLKKFIKAYNVPIEYVNKDGSIRDDAPLYPLYSDYGVGSNDGVLSWKDMQDEAIPDRLNTKDIEYDNRFNSKDNKQYRLHFTDGSANRIIGPNTKRGYSVAAYVNKNKRNGDDYFDGWYPDAGIEDAIYHNDIENDEKYQNTASNEQLDKKNSLSIIPSTAEKQTLGSRSFFKVPLIVTADTSDIININDVLNGNYDPSRDDLSEVQLKRIISKAAIPDTFTKVSSNYHMHSNINNAMSYILKRKDTLDEASAMFLDALNAFKADPKRRYNFIRLGALFSEVVRACTLTKGKCAEVMDLLSSNDTVNVQGLLSDIDTLSTFERELSILWKDNTRDNIVDHSLEAMKCLPNLQHVFDDILLQLQNIVDDSKLKDSQILIANPNLDISKYFDWNSDETYSDERLKDVYGSCHDVQLPNSMLQQIASDFVSYLLKSDNQGLITNAVKEFRI